MSLLYVYMLVFFHNFWNGFIECTDPVHIGFFIKLLSSIYDTPIELTYNINEANILVESIFGSYSYIMYKPWKATILFTGESYYSETVKPYVDLYTCILGFERTYKNRIACPLFLPYMLCNTYSYTPVSEIPTMNASVVISNGAGQIRNRFLDIVEQRIHVLYGGTYKNNIGGTIQGTYQSASLIDFYKKSKFAITMENSQEEFYITEKIINGFRAGVIPIYWGSPRSTTYFNSKRFLELKGTSDSDINALIDKMIHMTHDEYMSIINEPIFNMDIDDLFNSIVHNIKILLIS